MIFITYQNIFNKQKILLSPSDRTNCPPGAPRCGDICPCYTSGNPPQQKCINNKICAKSCTKKENCNDFRFPICHSKYGACVQCEKNSDCFSGKCSPNRLVCVSCLTNADCKKPTPICSDNGQCIECKINSDCNSDYFKKLCWARGYDNMITLGNYVECLDDTHCKNLYFNKPNCDNSVIGTHNCF